MGLKQSLRKLAYSSGFLHRYHNNKNHDALTVVLFHRVLPENSPEWETADPEWTVTREFFQECLEFFQKHYSVVSFPQVLDHYQNSTPLPGHSLLITFDDGWKCNLKHAAPLLSQFGFPAVVFVTSGAMGKSILSWQEALFALWKSGKLDDGKIAAMSQVLNMALPTGITSRAQYNQLLGILRGLPPKKRRLLDPSLIKWTEDLPGVPLMLEKEELIQLQEHGIHIGSHGVTHESLVRVDDAHQELQTSRQTLEAIPGQDQPILCFSPPQGQYDQETLKTAYTLGYQCACTNRSGLNPVCQHDGIIDLGRINIDQPYLLNERGTLDASKLASLLFRQPILDHV
ncbi:polysaccharide deacetylase family protein [Thiolapillus brandeum]|uniref:Polysaccharide deacetylase n=1 Tax=Thiolapillus brandeum TaxID=1076588 RepID=A0A7U6GKN5_9GAMM|nr:polysaccharide deacetylase family protein [Thiolapillus brandeum]BAO45421.1 polysaccharide deacetylase [Thiolapillus brandeum]